MSVTAKCSCGRSIVAKDAAAGKRVRCPVCSEPVRMPLLEAEETEDEYDMPPARLPRKRTSRKPQPAPSSRLPMIIGGIGGVSMLILGVIVWMVSGPRNQADNVQSPLIDATSSLNAAPPAALPATTSAVTPAASSSADTDYATARTQFQTRLIRKSGSPQPGEPVVAPPGTTLMSYMSGDLQLPAILGLPGGTGRHPAVVFLHGGFAFGDGDWDMSLPFINAGFAVMTPILRGENQQPGNFTLYYDEVDDVLAATDALVRHPQINPDRVFIAGHSAGGTLATLACLTSPRFRAAASFSGTMDIETGISGQSALVVFNPVDPKEIQMRSPLYFATSFKCPARLFHGVNEDFFAEQTQITARLAKASGLDVEHLIVPGDHFTSVTPATAQTIEFFRSKL